ncbi:hypothetical protein C8R43DRAFT_1115963 [Mycena crocata]|nr:hypothetical protein C8R43DRAFT_1115963 [Mycena crocata]
MSVGASTVFPPELEREVFEITALCYPGCLPTLILVAQRVRTWMEPFTYRIVSIHNPVKQKQICRRSLEEISTIVKSQPASFIHKHVRAVCFLDGTGEAIADILSAYTGTTNLALFSHADVTPALLPVLTALPLQRLSVILHNLFKPKLTQRAFVHPLFTGIRHVDVLDTRDGGWSAWAGLAALPRLTHLSFNDDVSVGLCESVLRHCGGLEALVVVWSSRQLLEDMADVYTHASIAADPRFAMIVIRRYAEDWERGASGGEDYWVRADALIKRRRAGETKCCLISFFD